MADAAAGAAGTWPTSRDGYTVGHLIGKGASAAVYAARCNTNGHEIAIKCIPLDQSGINMEEIHKEIQTMIECSHENVVKLYTSFVHRTELWLVMRLLGGGSAFDVMKAVCPKGIGMDEGAIAYILREALKGLNYFHKDGKIHRDVKAGNILVDLDGSVQLGDFGVSSHISDGVDRKGVRSTFVGTPCWMAPEVMEQSEAGYNVKADIWSFGITALELCEGAAPLAKFAPMKVLIYTLNNAPPTLDLKLEGNKKYSKKLKAMIDLCLTKDPAKRPSAQELLKNPFFQKAKDKKAMEAFLAGVTPITSRIMKNKTSRAKSGRMVKNQSGGWDFQTDEENDDNEDYIEECDVQMAALSMSDTDKELAKQLIQDNNQQIVNLKLRLIAGGKLKDISFGFIVGEDDAEVMAAELGKMIGEELGERDLITASDRSVIAFQFDQIVFEWLRDRERKEREFALPSRGPEDSRTVLTAGGSKKKKKTGAS